MSSNNKAIYARAGKFELREAPYPDPLPSEAIVRVTAVSLNRGEVRQSFARQDEGRPGWDLAGVIEQPAADGSSPEKGTRVVALMSTGAWANYVRVPSNAMAAIPDGVSDESASTMPVAGLTALHTLSKGGQLLGKRVLVGAATGGVGVFACQLARLSGAHVTAVIRKARDAEFVKQFGAHEVMIQDEADPAKAEPFHLALDSVGGETLAKTLQMLRPGGTCVSFGTSTGKPDATFNASAFYGKGRLTLYGFILFRELALEPASDGLAILLKLVAEGKLKVEVERCAGWSDIQQVAQELVDRKYRGKAVLKVQ